MDRRVFEMLELYKHSNRNEETRPNPSECYSKDYCKDTDYNAVNGDILTMAFVNMQPLESVYETDDGFPRGTIFPNIDKPFFGGKRI